jgi:hypothetical protein
LGSKSRRLPKAVWRFVFLGKAVGQVCHLTERRATSCKLTDLSQVNLHEVSLCPQCPPLS